MAEWIPTSNLRFETRAYQEATEPKGNQARGMCQIANRPACDSYPSCQCGQTLSPVQQGNL